MIVRKEPLNLNPIGPAHVFWPNGAPTRKAPFSGIYEIWGSKGGYYKRNEPFSEGIRAQ